MKKTSPVANDQLSELFHNTNCMLDRVGHIITWSKIAEKLTGYAPQEVIGKLYSIVFTEGDVGRNVFKKALEIAARKGRFITEGVRVKKDGSHFWARSIITLVKGRERDGVFFAVITQDITHERLVQQKRDEYIGIASHELKNPIATLSLYSELLAKRLELDRNKESLHMLHDIQSQTARLVTLINDLLTVSKIEGRKLELHKEAFNPNGFVKKIVRDMQNTTRTHKIICKGGVAREVRADKDRITQVLINLITNAIKYSSNGGKVHVGVESKKNKCVISVQDFGPGIEKKYQRQIFSRFFRTNEAEAGNAAGLGLGLYISKEIIKRHHEKLWVKSVVGKGTTFCFTLPLT